MRTLRLLAALAGAALLLGSVSASAQAGPVFRALDSSIVCSWSPVAGAASVACYSDQLLDRAPETGDCGSGASAALLRAAGRVRLHGVCNPFDLGVRVAVLRPGRSVSRGPLSCRAEARDRIRCASKRSGRGFRVAPARWSRW